MPETTRPIGPYSRPHALAKLDGRTRESRLLQSARAELAAHVGGAPSAVQRRLIDRAALLALRLALMDAKQPGGTLSEKAAREYLSWHNSYVRTLRELGPPAAARPLTLAEKMAAAAAQDEAPAAPRPRPYDQPPGPVRAASGQNSSEGNTP